MIRRTVQTNSSRRFPTRVTFLCWLECCRKEAATTPGVREAITQYIHLIQRLTQQNTSAHMNSELIKVVLQDKDTYLAYANLRNANWARRCRVNAQLEPIAQELKLETVEKFSGQEKYEGCFFTTPALKAQNLKFGIECQSSDYQDFCFGFTYIGPDRNSALKQQIELRFKAAFPVFNSSPDWPACPWCEHHRYWKDETMSAILSGEFAQDLKALIGKLPDVATAAITDSAVLTR